MQTSPEASPQRKIVAEIVDDLRILSAASIAAIQDKVFERAVEVLASERRRVTGTLVKAIIAMPLIIIATLFSGAAGVEFLADTYPLPLSILYAFSALGFFLLAIVILLLPVARSSPGVKRLGEELK